MEPIKGPLDSKVEETIVRIITHILNPLLAKDREAILRKLCNRFDISIYQYDYYEDDYD